jgi:ABC-type multidrug transport system ATPase subunit
MQLQVEGLSCQFAGVTLFDRWSRGVGPGITLVQGDEGRGKSTLLRLLAGQQAADAGVLQIGAVRLDADPEAYRAQVYLADLHTDAFDQITPMAYLGMVQERHSGFVASQVATLIEGLSLTEHQHKPMYMLSTGSRRKVWFAAAAACGAPLTLVDEPFAALDRRSAAFVCEVLRAQGQRQDRVWILADYVAPEGVPLAGTIDLG